MMTNEHRTGTANPAPAAETPTGNSPVKAEGPNTLDRTRLALAVAGFAPLALPLLGGRRSA